ncbi:MAG: hypothetical protein JXA90_05600 [Planctomycetes bacterium]|nr:hypothetical protein [Planctomycetota bacterium]
MKALLRLAPAILLLIAAGCGSRGASAAALRRLEVRVLDARTGRPVSGILVSVRFPAGGSLAPASTGADGRASWQDGSTGPAEVVAGDPQGRYVPAVLPFPSSGSAEVRLTPGVRIEFAVRGVDGAPLSGRGVVWGADAARGMTFPFCESGDLEIGPIAAGPIKLFVSAEGHETRVLDLNVPRKGGTLGEIRLERGGSRLSGRVLPDHGVRPAEAFFRFAGAGLATPVAPDGRFEFRGLPRTDGTLVLRRGGRELFSRPVHVDRSTVDLETVQP